MADDTRPTKVYKMILCYVDHDCIGPDGVKDLLENTRYPNHTPAPSVISIETREVEWQDSHPLNSARSEHGAFEELFE